jgi:hypothetical protein
MNFVLLFNMMMWIPQDPFNTGALHAFLLNLDDIPIITRKNKHAMPIMAIKTLNEPRRESPRQDYAPRQEYQPRQDFAKTSYAGGTVLLSTTSIAPGVTIKAWWNPKSEIKAPYKTYTVTVDERSFTMMDGFLENWINTMTTVTKHFPIVPNPVLHFPQTSKMGNGSASNEITEYMAANSTKLISLTSTKTAPNPSPKKATRILDVDAAIFVKKESQNNDERLKTAAIFLKMYGLDDCNVSHSVFKSLALYLDVDVGPTTSTLTTRNQALDTLSAAMAELLQNDGIPPTFTDVMTQAEEIEKTILTPTPTSGKSTKAATKIPKKLKDNVVIEIEDNEICPNEHKGKNKKQ